MIGDNPVVEQQITQVFNLAAAEVDELPVADARESAREVFRRHRVFGGRKEDLAALDRFAAESSNEIFLLTGKSGYGKTALLARWIEGRLDAGAPTAFHFISKVDGLADQSTTLTSLCRQLASWHGLRGTLPTSIPSLAELYGLLLHRPHSGGEPLVLVVDALDEANGWERSVGHWLVAPPLPAGVRVVLSAREIADVDWLAKLDLGDAGVETRSLGRLSAGDGAEMLAAAGGEASERAGDLAFATRLTTLAEGDPYFLRLLVGDVEADRLGALQGLDPESHDGLTGYFDAWWRELAAATGGSAEEVRDLLGYLVASEWPIPKRDLVDISPDDALDSFRVEPAIAAVQRHLVGNGIDGYTLSHDRFRDHLNRSAFSPDLQEKFRSRLLSYCAAWPENRSRYALERYALALDRADRLDELLALVRDPDWAAAKLDLDSSAGSFKRDLVTARTALRRRNGGDALKDSATSIADEIGIALRLATVSGFSGKMPEKALRELLASGEWSEEDVLAVLDEIPNDERRLHSIEALAPDLSRDGLAAAAEIARRLPFRTAGGWSHPRPRALASLGKQAGLAETGIVGDAFAARREMVDDFAWLTTVVGRLAPLLSKGQLLEAADAAAELPDPPEQVVTAIADALIAAAGVATALDALASRSSQLATTAIVHLSSSIEGKAPAAVVRCACKLPASGPGGRSPRGASLVALSPYLSGDGLVDAVKAAGEIASPEWSVWTLSHLIRAGASGVEISTLLEEARALAQPSWRANVLAVLAPLAPDPAAVAAAAVADAAEIDVESQKAPALCAAVPHLADSELTAAAAALSTLTMPELIEKMLTALAGRLPAAELHEAVRSAIAGLEPPPGAQVKATVALAAHLPTGEREEVLGGLIPKLGEEDMYALVDLASALDEETLWEQRNRACESALRAARDLPAHEHGVYEVSPRADALAELIGVLPPDRAASIVAETLAALRVTCDPAERGLLLAELLPTLDGKMRAGTFALAAETTPEDGLDLLASLMPDANEKEATQLLDTIGELQLDPDNHAELLTLAAEQLPGPAAARAQEGLRSLLEERTQSPTEFLQLVIRLAPRLSGEQLRHALVLLDATLPAGVTEVDGAPVSLRDFALRNLHPHLSDRVAAEALDLAAAIDEETRRVCVQLRLAPILPGPRKAEIVSTAAAYLTEQQLAADVINLAVALAPLQSGEDARATTDLLLRALRAFAADTAAEHAVDAIRVAAPVLDGANAEAALELLGQLPDTDTVVAVRAQLRGRLGRGSEDDLPNEPIDEALAIDDPELRWAAIVELAPIAPADRRRELAEAAVRAAMSFDDVGAAMAGEALEKLALSPDDRRFLLLQALGAADSILPTKVAETSEIEMTALHGPIAEPSSGVGQLIGQPAFRMRRLPNGRQAIERVGPRAVSLVQGDYEVPFHNHRLDRLPSADRVALVGDVIARVAAHDPQFLVSALTPLAPHLPLDALEPLIADGLADPGWERALAIELLAPPLPRFVVGRPISRRRRWREARDLAVISALLPGLRQLDTDQRYNVLRRMLDVFAQQPRPFFLIDLQTVAAWIAELDEGAPGALARELIDVDGMMPTPVPR